MFSTFTTKNGVLIVRSASIVRMEDISPYDRAEAEQQDCRIVWEEAGTTEERRVNGSAAENYARLQQEELAAIAEAQRIDQRRANNLPILPVARGRP